jgi:hypothetical protein
MKQARGAAAAKLAGAEVYRESHLLSRSRAWATSDWALFLSTPAAASVRRRCHRFRPDRRPLRLHESHSKIKDGIDSMLLCLAAASTDTE